MDAWVPEVIGVDAVGALVWQIGSRRKIPGKTQQRGRKWFSSIAK